MFKKHFLQKSSCLLALSLFLLQNTYTSVSALTTTTTQDTYQIEISNISKSGDIVLDSGVWKDELYSNEKYNHSLPYRLFLPNNYDPNKEYPLVLFLHGAGERGTDNTYQITGAPDGPNLFVNKANQEEFPSIVIAPQCPNGEQWVDTPWENGSYSLDNVKISDEMEMVIDIIDLVQSKYNIDSNRLYSTGISMGGYGTWNINMLYPDKFAAMVPICGAADPNKAELLKDKPIWTFHGDADNVVPVSGTRDMVNAIKTLGGSPKYTEYPGVYHNSWTRAYSTEGLLDWIFAQELETIIPCDFNKDGVINFSDLSIASKNYGSSSKDHDLNGNGLIDSYEIEYITNIVLSN